MIARISIWISGGKAASCLSVIGGLVRYDDGVAQFPFRAKTSLSTQGVNGYELL